LSGFRPRIRPQESLPASFGDDHFGADTAKLGPQIPIFQRHLHKTTGKFKIYILDNMFAIFGSNYRLEVMWLGKAKHCNICPCMLNCVGSRAIVYNFQLIY
jgi:hypothetical protein